MVNKKTFKQLALSFPDTIELPHFERASFRVNKKIFATLDAKNNRACVMLSEIDQSVFSAYDKSVIYPVPNKWGKKGATYVELKAVSKNVLKDALTQAYRKITKTTPATKFKTVDQYVSAFPTDVRDLLKDLQMTIKKAAPRAEEVISYNMPAFKWNGILVYFAGYKNHIGFYPGASGIAAFRKKLAGYKSAKGSVQFSIDKPLPLELVIKIVKFRAKENLEKAKRKKR